jgi:hypothetical protein
MDEQTVKQAREKLDEYKKEAEECRQLAEELGLPAVVEKININLDTVRKDVQVSTAGFFVEKAREAKRKNAPKKMQEFIQEATEILEEPPEGRDEKQSLLNTITREFIAQQPTAPRAEPRAETPRRPVRLVPDEGGFGDLDYELGELLSTNIFLAPHKINLALELMMVEGSTKRELNVIKPEAAEEIEQTKKKIEEVLGEARRDRTKLEEVENKIAKRFFNQEEKIDELIGEFPEDAQRVAFDEPIPPLRTQEHKIVYLYVKLQKVLKELAKFTEEQAEV